MEKPQKNENMAIIANRKKLSFTTEISLKGNGYALFDKRVRWQQ